MTGWVLPALLAVAGGAQETCGADACEVQLRHDVPERLGQWLEGALGAVCSEAFGRKLEAEGREGEQALFDAFLADRTPLGDGSAAGNELSAKLALFGRGLDEPDCAKLEHYLLHLPAYARAQAARYDLFIFKPGPPSPSLLRFENQAGRTNLQGTDVLVRLPLGRRAPVELFAPGLAPDRRPGVLQAVRLILDEERRPRR